MTTLNKFFPAGNKSITHSFMKNHTCNSSLLCCKRVKDDMKAHLQECNCDFMDNPQLVDELWKKMGSPSATIFMCGYKILNGKIL